MHPQGAARSNFHRIIYGDRSLVNFVNQSSSGVYCNFLATHDKHYRRPMHKCASDDGCLIKICDQSSKEVTNQVKLLMYHHGSVGEMHDSTR
jgi:hypothetical protein